MEYYFGEKEVPFFFLSTRFSVAVLGFFGFLAMNAQRLAMNLVLPCMVNNTYPFFSDEFTDDAAHNSTTNSTHEPQVLNYDNCDSGMLLQLDVIKTKLNFAVHQRLGGDLTWSLKRQEILFSVFYWGYVVSLILSGWLAERYGGKKVFGVFMGLLSGSNLLIPLSTKLHYFLLIFLRFTAGVGAGAALPAMHAMWGKWAPPLERTILAALTFSGLLAGRIVVVPLVSGLCQYGFLGGWPSVFYVLGAYGIIWTVLWMVSMSEFPRHHRRLSRNEKRYLHSTLAGETIQKPRTALHVPFVSIITSLPFLATLMSHFTYEWILYVYDTVIPVYFSEVLNISYHENAYFALIPPVGAWIFVLLSGMWTDQLRSRGVMHTAPARKIMNTIGTVIPVAMLVGLSLIDCRQWIGAVCMLTIGVAFLGFQFSGWWLSHLDMAPQYAGFLMGMTSSVGTLADIAAPFVLQQINTKNTHEQWQTFFLISASLMLFSTLCFLVKGTGQIQEWAEVDEIDKCAEDFTTDNSTNTSTSYTSSSQESLDSVVKKRASDHLDDVFLSPRDYAAHGGTLMKYGTLPRSFRPENYSKKYSPRGFDAELGRSHNIDKYGTLPKHWNGSHWHDRKHSDTELHEHAHYFNDSSNRRLLATSQYSIPPFDAAKYSERQKAKKNGGAQKSSNIKPKNSIQADPPSTDRPSSSSQSSGRASSKRKTQQSIL